MRTLEEALKAGRTRLRERNITEGDLDAWYLLSYYFKIDRPGYYRDPAMVITPEQYEGYLRLIHKREEHIPLQYITGEQEFMGLNFHVTEDVLIPRQDTEILVEQVLKRAKGKDILDLCTGSGCIAISLAVLGGTRRTVGTDISKEALVVAEQNAKSLNANVEFIQSDMYSRVTGQFDIIVSNPPYIPTCDIAALMDEVREHEPVIALDGRSDGLYFYQIIINGLSHYLKQGGYVFFEIGYNQGRAVSVLLEGKGITDIRIIKDLAGLDRVVCGRYVLLK